VISPSHNLPVTPPPAPPGDSQRAARIDAPSPAGERRSAPREQITRQVAGERLPSERSLDGELQDELLRSQANWRAAEGGFRASLEGLSLRAVDAIHSYESVRSASPAHPGSSGVLLDTYA